MNWTEWAREQSKNGRRVDLLYCHGTLLEVNVHRHSSNEPLTYADGVSVMRELGIQKWEKQIVNDWSTLTGKVGNVPVCVFASDLPPTCKLVKYIEKIPKTQTVENAEFIEVERYLVQCGQEDV